MHLKLKASLPFFGICGKLRGQSVWMDFSRMSAGLIFGVKGHSAMFAMDGIRVMTIATARGTGFSADLVWIPETLGQFGSDNSGGHSDDGVTDDHDD